MIVETAVRTRTHEQDWLTAFTKEGIINSLKDLQVIIESIPVGIVVASQEGGDIVYANLEAADILQLPPTSIRFSSIGSLLDLINLDGSEFTIEHSATARARRSGQEERATFGVRYPNGSIRWVAVRAIPLVLPDGTGVVISTLTGITEIIEAQHQQAEMIRLQDELSANISHELRTPLAIILGFAGEMAERWDEFPETTRRQYVGFIHKNANTMHWLIRNLLMFYRSEATGLDDTSHEPMSLSALVAERVSIARDGLATKAGITLTVGELEPVTICGHLMQLELALNNLLMNAIKFSSPGGTVHVELVEDGDTCILSITDTGIGITPAVMAHLFEPFRQGDGSDTRRHGGVGLGLSVVKKIVDAHHGRIEVESEPGKGSTFRVYLPLLVMDEDHV